MGQDEDPLSDIRASFFVEAEELLEALQDGLQAIEDGVSDDETINVVFRAVHSIKGGAAAFGLDELVEFAHNYESTLDLVRSYKLEVVPEVLSLFFSAADLLGDLVRACREGTAIDTDAHKEVLRKLAALCSEDAAPEEIEFAPISLDLDIGTTNNEAIQAGGEKAGHHRISFKPHADLYATGNEPIYIFRALEKLGRTEISLEANSVLTLTDWHDEEANLRWCIDLFGDANEAQISEMFDFVSDVCDLEIAWIESDVQASAADGPGVLGKPDSSPAQTLPKKLTTQSNKADNGRAAASPLSQSTIRVGLEKIDRLMNLVGELVINQAMLSQRLIQADLLNNSEISQGLDEFMQLTRQIQDSVMSVRAQPVKSLFQRMSRVVREASAELDKEVRLKCVGESTEVDKTVIERLAEPLTHMVRNAVDHGLESSETRLSSGKPQEGTISLSALHQSGRVIIEIADDGGGINRAKVRANAIEKGLIAEDAVLNKGEIDNLLFLPGFSTSEEVSALSGRGVGMDVVKTSIQSLGGRVGISSVAGKGTTFSISLPLTLAVLDGMVIEVAGETLVMPLSAILETLTLTDRNLRLIGPGQFAVEIRGEILPMVDLGVSLGFRNTLESYYETIVLVVTTEEGEKSTLVVDEIIDQRQVVIKGFQSALINAPGVSAATILGDGQIALIVDPIELTKSKIPGKANFSHLRKAG